MATLKLLADIKSPDLIEFDRAGIIDDLVLAIQNDPDWNALWDGELLQNASFMIMNYFAFMAEKGYNQFNKSIRENFLYEAKDPVAIASILAQRNINLFQNRAASVTVSASVINAIITDSMLSTDVDGNKLLSIPNGLKILGSDLNNANTVFEAIPIAQDGKPNYKDDLKVIIGQSNRITFDFDVIAGQSVQEGFLLAADHQKNFYLDLETTNIIEGSVRVYWQFGTPDEIELTEVEAFGPTIKFTDPDQIAKFGSYFPFGLPSYIAKFNTNGGCRIYLGNDRFGGSFANQENKVLTVFVRTGGGEISNINAGKINYTTEIPVSAVTNLSVKISNEKEASGGFDRETLTDAKIFAPLRNENSKVIVGDNDALNILRTLSNKQKVDSPFYNIAENKVPILHSYNFIAPNRDFTNFIFPLVLANDTASTYSAKFIQALNDFLNLQGIKDGAVTGEVLTDFFYDAQNDNYNQYVKLKDSNPMNGSLILKAFKYNGNKTDQIEFALNYLSGIIFNTSTKVPARVYSTVPFVNVVSSFSVPSNQNKLILNFDESGDLAIELAAITYINVDAFASAFNDLIKTQLALVNPTYYSLRTTHTWVYYDAEEKRLIIESPTKGFGSSVRVKDSLTNSALAFFGISVSYNVPLSKTENVFLDETTYNVLTDEIYLAIRRNNIPRTVEKDVSELSLVQNPNAPDGPVYELEFKDFNNIDLDKIRLGSNILIDFYVQSGNNLVLKEEFRVKVPLVSLTNNTVANNLNGVGSLVPPADSIIKFDQSSFDYETSKLKLAFVDSLGINNALPIVPPYIGNFDASIDNAKVTYKYKIPKEKDEVSGDFLWNGSETANILTTGLATNIPLGFQIKDNTNIRITLLDPNDNVVSGTATIQIGSSNIIGNITFPFNTFPTCYAMSAVVTKTGSASDYVTFTLQNGFNFGTSFASYPTIRKIKTVKIEYITEATQVENITTLSNPEFFVQNATQSQGPRLDLILTKDADTISQDVDILVEALAGVTLKESFTISQPLNFNDNNIASFIVGPVADPLGFFKNFGGNPDINFLKITSGPDLNKLKLSLKVKDSLSILNAPVPPYLINPLLSQVKKMVIHYERKTYDFITADYKQDVYYPIGEAKTISDILNASGTKLMSFHHLIKRVEFIPTPLEINLKVKKGISPVTATAQTKALILQYYGYMNTNYNHAIGNGFSYSDLNVLLNRNDLNPGIDSANIVIPSQTIIDDSDLKNRYYFVLPQLILDQIYALEQDNPNISGVGDLYSVVINPQK